MKAASDDYTSEEFHQEVMEELIKLGATPEQAANATRDGLRLHNVAIQLRMK
jgi:hypothetical protein